MTAVSEHLAEVKGSVRSAGKLAQVNVKGKLPVQHREEIVGAIICQEIDTRRGQAHALGLVDEQVECQLTAVCNNAVAGVVSTF